MKARNRIVSIILTVLVVCTIVSPIGYYGVAEEVTAFSQYDSRWANEPYYYNKSRTSSNTIAKSACGPLSLKNVIYYLTNIEVDTIELCNYASDHNYHTDGTGRRFFKDYLDAKGAQYGVEFVCRINKYGEKPTVSQSIEMLNTAKQYLLNGDAVVCHVPGHYMAIVKYNSSTDKYLLLDSAANSKNRPLTKTKNTPAASAVWLTEDEIVSVDLRSDGGPMNDFFVVAKTGSPTIEIEQYTIGRYKINTSTNLLNMRQYASGSSTVLTRIPKGVEVNVTSISGKWGKTTYNNVTGWINLGYCIYCGTSTSTED